MDGRHYFVPLMYELQDAALRPPLDWIVVLPTTNPARVTELWKQYVQPLSLCKALIPYHSPAKNLQLVSYWSPRFFRWYVLTKLRKRWVICGV